MPRSVRVAIVAACVVALLGVASIVGWAVALVTGDAVSAALGTRAFGPLVSPMLAGAIIVPKAALERDDRLRELSFQLALFTAILVGLLALGELVAALIRGADANVVVSWSVFVLAVVLASSLTRPSAKAWFRSPAGQG